MPVDTQAIALFNNIGGLNDNFDPLHIEDNEASDLLNVYFDRGSICKRPGSTKKNDTAIAMGTYGWTGLYGFQTQDGANRYLMGCADDEIYWCSATSDEFDSIRDTTMTSDALWDFATFIDSSGNSIAILTNNNEGVRKWTGSGNTAALGGSPAFSKAKYLEVHNNQLCVGYTDESGTSLPSRVRVSDIKNGESWSTNGYFDVSSDDDYITGMASFGDFLVVFERDHIYLANGWYPTNWSSHMAVKGTGCVAHRSIQTIESPHFGRALIFLAEDGIHIFQGGASAPRISDRIQETINGLNKSKLKYACSVNYKKRGIYLLFVADGSSTTNNVCILYDYFNNALSLWDIPASAAAIVENDTDVPECFTGDYQGFVLKQDQGNADGGDGDNGVVDSATTTTMVDGSKSWDVNEWQGVSVRITTGTGFGQERVIASNTSDTLTVSAWDTDPDATSEYSIGFIKAHYTTKWFHYGNTEMYKGIRKIEMILSQEGDYDLEIYDKNDFETGDGTRNTVNLLADAIPLGTFVLGTDVLGGKESFFKMVNLERYAKYVQFTFQNYRENQPFKIHGWINHIKPGRKGE